MPTICIFRGIKIYMNWREHQPPHFHAKYGSDEVAISINDIEVLEGSLPNKQLKNVIRLDGTSPRRTVRELAVSRTEARFVPD